MTRSPRAAAGAALLAIFVGAAAWVAALAAAPTVLAGDPCFHGYSIPPTTTAASTSVGMEPCAFVPTNVTVATGATVTFTNTSGQGHLLTGANQAWGHREQEIGPGDRVSVTFDEPGVYAFSCALHRGMSGAVIVGASADGAAAGLVAPGASSGSDAGVTTTLTAVLLAALGALGWALLFVQRRRMPVSGRSESEPVRAST